MSTLVLHYPGGARIGIRIEDAGLSSDLVLRASRLSDVRPLWAGVANIVRKSWAENFRAGGRPRWAPLAGGTLHAKAALGLAKGYPYATLHGRTRIRRLEQVGAQGGRPARSTANILIATGRYRDSWATKSADHIENISKDHLDIGSKHPLAPIHEFGTGTYGPRGAPYIIKPVRAKSLRFFGPNGVIFASSVIHPGVPARPVGVLQEEDADAISDLFVDRYNG